MGLLDSISSALGGQGAGQAALLPVLMDQIKKYPGGLQGLLASFREGGLGEVIASWVGPGQNLPISTDQVQSVLGDGMINAMAQESGQDKGDVLRNLTSLLPSLVDQATPDGEESAASGLDDNLLGSVSSLLGKL